jgi:hypothetical protein
VERVATRDPTHAAHTGPRNRPEGRADGRLTGGDAVRLHVTLAAGLALCISAFCFELLRALGGHSFSWMYVFEWPLFAGFAIYMWWNLLQGNDRRRPSAGDDGDPAGPEHSEHSAGSAASPATRTGADGTGDQDLEAWQRYLRQMEAAEAEQAD